MDTARNGCEWERLWRLWRDCRGVGGCRQRPAAAAHTHTYARALKTVRRACWRARSSGGVAVAALAVAVAAVVDGQALRGVVGGRQRPAAAAGYGKQSGAVTLHRRPHTHTRAGDDQASVLERCSGGAVVGGGDREGR
jgi:hypothetical protein